MTDRGECVGLRSTGANKTQIEQVGLVTASQDEVHTGNTRTFAFVAAAFVWVVAFAMVALGAPCRPQRALTSALSR